MYNAEITRHTPTAFCILVDMSGSMQEFVSFCSNVMTKAEAVGCVVNTLISELIDRSRREDGIRDYFEVAVLGYGDGRVISLIESDTLVVKPSYLAGKETKYVSRSRQVTMPDGRIAISRYDEKLWIELDAKGDTPMLAGLIRALEVISLWCNDPRNSNSYPPTLLHVTDGEASDANHQMLIDVAQSIKSTGTADGNTLLININIGNNIAHQTIFPCSTALLPNNRYAGLLYDMSSTMPEAYNERIMELKADNQRAPFKGMGFNTTIVDLLSMMSIGSVSSNVY